MTEDVVRFDPDQNTDSDNKLTLEINRQTRRNYNREEQLALRNELYDLMSRQFSSCDVDTLPYDMTTIKGQCQYWQYIVKRLRVGTMMHAAHYKDLCCRSGHHDEDLEDKLENPLRHYA